jgi:hypothetical protein
MDTKKNIKEEIELHAEKLLFYKDMIAKQSDTWLSEEEGNKNMVKEIRARREAESRSWKRGLLLVTKKNIINH